MQEKRYSFEDLDKCLRDMIVDYLQDVGDEMIHILFPEELMSADRLWMILQRAMRSTRGF